MKKTLLLSALLICASSLTATTPNTQETLFTSEQALKTSQKLGPQTDKTIFTEKATKAINWTKENANKVVASLKNNAQTAISLIKDNKKTAAIVTTTVVLTICAYALYKYKKNKKEKTTV